MQWPAELLTYLRGEQFSNGLELKISAGSTPLVDRLDYLEHRVRGKRVIHLGCVDHLEILEEKRRAGKWLHDRLSAAAVECLGIDNNVEGIRHIRENLGMTPVVAADISGPLIPEITDGQWEYLILGEILEHVDNPVSFLSSIRSKYRDRIVSMLVSVPNALRMENVFASLRHSEIINSDHRFWFTPYTLAKVGQRAGFEPIEFTFCSTRIPGRRELIRRMALSRFPALRDTLMMEFRL
jgi:hypothetical protein